MTLGLLVQLSEARGELVVLPGTRAVADVFGKEGAINTVLRNSEHYSVTNKC